MTDAELHRLADLCRVLDHLELHGFAGSFAHARLLAERDRAVVSAAVPDPGLRTIPSAQPVTPGNRKAKR